MKHASLFSGIGGFDLASHWMGWQNIFWCENDDFCRQILKYYFRNSIGYGDIKTTGFRLHAGQIDILTGGFPCQPFSDAGLKGGTSDPRYLWPEMYRAVREIRPRWVIAENVRGLISWNAGLVFETVRLDLENEGYEVWPFLLPACGVDAPHQRYRIWFVAYANGNDAGRRRFKKARREKTEGKTNEQKWERIRENVKRISEASFITDPASYRPQTWTEVSSEISRELVEFDGFPTQSPVCSRDDGFPAGLDGITFPKWRQQSIKGFGNAVVSQLAIQIFRTIESFEKIL